MHQSTSSARLDGPVERSRQSEQAYRRTRDAILHAQTPIGNQRLDHAAVVEAIRRGDPQSAGAIHRGHKRRWIRELDDNLGRFDVAAAAGAP